MQITAAQIAAIIGGKLTGNSEQRITGFAKIEEAQSGDLCFIANPKYETYLKTSQASVIIINDSLAIPDGLEATLIAVPDAYMAFTRLMQEYQKLKGGGKKSGVESPAFIHDTATVGNDVFIGAFSYVAKDAAIGEGTQIFPQVYIGEGVRIGKNSVLHPGVKVYTGCIIGNEVIIHAGTIIGADGFGFAPQADGSYQKVPQLGNVIIEDQVEIGANTTIDRATMGSTRIQKQAKLDNLIQIAHNVTIGENTVIAAQAGISGSTKLGARCMVGGQVGMVGHLTIADETRINAQSGISKSVLRPGTALNGSPAFDYKSSLKSQAIFRNLPELQAKINELEIKIKSIPE